MHVLETLHSSEKACVYISYMISQGTTLKSWSCYVCRTQYMISVHNTYRLKPSQLKENFVSKFWASQEKPALGKTGSNHWRFWFTVSRRWHSRSAVATQWSVDHWWSTRCERLATAALDGSTGRHRTLQSYSRIKPAVEGRSRRHSKYFYLWSWFYYYSHLQKGRLRLKVFQLIAWESDLTIYYSVPCGV